MWHGGERSHHQSSTDVVHTIASVNIIWYQPKDSGSLWLADISDHQVYK